MYIHMFRESQAFINEHHKNGKYLVQSKDL